MNLCAALVVRNERERYLPLVIDHLLGFCDLVVCLDDASDDGTSQYLADHPDNRVRVFGQPRSTFYAHEGKTRQHLLDVTLGHDVTHVLSIDGDEFVSDGQRLRALLEAQPDVPVWSLGMLEVWRADDPNTLGIRVDGGWRPHQLSLVWKAPPHGERFRMLDRKLACRRVPMQVLSQRAKPSGMDCLHLGWTDKATRQARYDRYVRHDNGKFHASAHLRSIMWSDARVQLRQWPWPAGAVFDELRERFAGVTA